MNHYIHAQSYGAYACTCVVCVNAHVHVFHTIRELYNSRCTGLDLMFELTGSSLNFRYDRIFSFINTNAIGVSIYSAWPILVCVRACAYVLLRSNRDNVVFTLFFNLTIQQSNC